MRPKHAPGATRSHIRPVWHLIGAFTLTIASFMASTAVAEHRSRGIEAAAESIAANALPSVEHIVDSRTQLRQLEFAIERLTDPAVPPEVLQRDLVRLQQARSALAATWHTYLHLPDYAGERTLQKRIDDEMREMNASIDTVIRIAKGGDSTSARSELTSHAEPLLDALDAQLVELAELNARESAMLGAKIADIRASSRRVQAALTALSAVLAAVAAMLMIRMIDRFTKLMELRVSEMEHFAARVAHDIRSPLSAVGLAIELTKQDPDASIRRGVLDRASRTLQRVGQLVDGLLVFARSGANPPEATMADLSTVVEDVADTLRPHAEESGIALDVELATPAATVACAPGVLISIISNLVGNAIKYMSGSPVRRVEIRTFDLGAAVRVEVCDTGPGVPASERGRIFDPYIRAAASTVPGIGLGLATVRRLTEAHGGTVGVFPNHGSGCVFWFELPKAEMRNEPSQAATAVSTAGVRSGVRS